MPKKFVVDRGTPLNDQRQAFVDAYVENGGKGGPAYKDVYGHEISDEVAKVNASRLLTIAAIKNSVENLRLELQKTRKLALLEKQAALSKMALENLIDVERIDDDGNTIIRSRDGYLALGAIKELNKMEGDYAPTKVQKTVGNFNFVQHFNSENQQRPAEKQVDGEVVED